MSTPPQALTRSQRVDPDASLDLLTQAAQLNYDQILAEATEQGVTVGPHASKLKVDATAMHTMVYVETTAPVINLDDTDDDLDDDDELEDEDDD